MQASVDSSRRTTFEISRFRLIHRKPHGTAARSSRRSRVSGTVLSQSEHDWAYAKRALARGDDPDEIIRRIADFRSEDKPSPEYYARHTVMNAQADLQSKAANTEVAFAEMIPGIDSTHDRSEMP